MSLGQARAGREPAGMSLGQAPDTAVHDARWPVPGRIGRRRAGVAGHRSHQGPQGGCRSNGTGLGRDAVAVIRPIRHMSGDLPSPAHGNGQRYPGSSWSSAGCPVRPSRRAPVFRAYYQQAFCREVTVCRHPGRVNARPGLPRVLPYSGRDVHVRLIEQHDGTLAEPRLDKRRRRPAVIEEIRHGTPRASRRNGPYLGVLGAARMAADFSFVRVLGIFSGTSRKIVRGGWDRLSRWPARQARESTGRAGG